MSWGAKCRATESSELRQSVLEEHRILECLYAGELTFGSESLGS